MSISDGEHHPGIHVPCVSRCRATGLRYAENGHTLGFWRRGDWRMPTFVNKKLNLQCRKAVVATISGDVADEIQDYRPLCGLAMVGLILAILSVAAYFGPALWALPFVAVIVNVLALRRIAAEAPRLGGRKAAVVGLVLALFLGSAAVAMHTTRVNLETSEAQFVIDRWFATLKSGDVPRAHQLMIDYQERKGEGDLAAYYQKDENLRKQVAAMRANPLYALVLDPAKQVTPYWESTLENNVTNYQQWTVELYKLKYVEDGQEKSTMVKVTVQRRKPYSYRAHDWKVSSMEPQ